MENEKAAPEASVEVVKRWDGYTLDELRYQRVLMMAKAEVEKMKLVNAYENVVHGVKTSEGGRQTIIGRMLGTLSYIDYGVIAFRIGSKLFRAFKAIRRK